MRDLTRSCPAAALLLALAALRPARRARAQGGKGKKYALLAGITHYNSTELAKLRYTENDVEELARVFKGAGFAEAVVLTTSRGQKDRKDAPTAANIRAAL